MRELKYDMAGWPQVAYSPSLKPKLVPRKGEDDKCDISSQKKAAELVQKASKTQSCTRDKSDWFSWNQNKEKQKNLLLRCCKFEDVRPKAKPLPCEAQSLAQTGTEREGDAWGAGKRKPSKLCNLHRCRAETTRARMRLTISQSEKQSRALVFFQAVPWNILCFYKAAL